tara:strand:+ start:453 stop:698 length:246 start_codon:yes stop_codon:yes gene_type:complete
MDANKTEAAEQSLAIFANLLYSLLILKSTKVSIAVFINSRINTEKIIAITVINSYLLQFIIKQKAIANKPKIICIRKFLVD